MPIKVAINGFGRIGRLAFRQMFGVEGYRIVAINDLTDPSILAYLLKYDSTQHRYDGHTVEHTEDSIVVDGEAIKICSEKDAAKLPWKELGVDVVLECTGIYTSKVKAQAHLDAGARKVVISAPAGNDMKMGRGHPNRLLAALEKGALTREELEKAGINVLRLILRLD